MSIELITSEDYLKRHLKLNTLEVLVDPFCILYNGKPTGLGKLEKEVHTSYKNYHALMVRIQTFASAGAPPTYNPPHGRHKTTTAICNHLKALTEEVRAKLEKETL